MTITDFINLHEGAFLDFDGMYGAQCVDLVQFWCQANSWPTFWGNAIDIISQAGGTWNRIDNAPDNFPATGDIIVWGENSNIGTGPAGHVAVCVNADVNQFDSFDQNWPEGSPCHVQHHGNYAGVIGWLTPISVAVPASVSSVDPAPAVEPAQSDPVPADAGTSETVATPSTDPVPQTDPPQSDPQPILPPPASETPSVTPSDNTNASSIPLTPTVSQPQNKDMNKLKSRKLWMTILADAVAIGGAFVGYLNSGQTVTLLGIVTAAYVVMQGLIDHKNAGVQ